MSYSGLLTVAMVFRPPLSFLFPGHGQASLEPALEYTKTRKQFGQSISSFQVFSTWFCRSSLLRAAILSFFPQPEHAIQARRDGHRLQSSRLMVRQAARMLDQGFEAAPAYCAMAKVHATDECFQVARKSARRSDFCLPVSFVVGERGLALRSVMESHVRRSATRRCSSTAATDTSRTTKFSSG